MRARMTRLAIGAVAAVLVLAVATGVAAVQYGAWALDSTGGGIQTVPPSAAPLWVGYELTNRSAVPITIRELVPHDLRNLRVLETRVVDLRHGGGLGFGAIGAPLPEQLRRDLDHAAPADGFVLPAGSRSRYELVVLVQRIRAGRVAELGRSAVAYRALGLDQGAIFELVTRIRAR